MVSDSSIRFAVIGAGPFGLSIAAHLRALTTDIRIFGRPMDTWLSHMPDGMFLKSEGFASNLSEPSASYTLASFCARNGLDYEDQMLPIPIETFRRYGLAFRKDCVTNVEVRTVVSVEKKGIDFEIVLDDGELVRARNVIVAVGVAHFAHAPFELHKLPKELISHTRDHVNFAQFKGKDVTIVGGGQSALETAALLHEQGARGRVLLRRSSAEWNRQPENRSLYERLTKPRTPLGRGRRSWVYSNCPLIFHYLPERRRIEIVSHVLGPAGAWWLRDRVQGKTPLCVNSRIVDAQDKLGRVHLKVEQDGMTRELVTDHVIAGTGYVVDIRRLSFLGSSIASRLNHARHVPVLSRSFESSVAGLYFVGLAAALSFGPIMRFVAGATPASRHLVRHFRNR